MSHIPFLTPEYLHSLPAPHTPQHSLMPPNDPLMPSTCPRSPQYHFMPPIPLLAPEYLHFLPAPNVPLTSLHPLTAPQSLWHPLHSLGAPMLPYATYTLSGPGVSTLPASSPKHPQHPFMASQHPWHPLHTLVFYHCHLQLTIFTSMCSLQYIICSWQEYICSTVKLSQFLQYLPKHAPQRSSYFTILKDQQSGLHMEIWLTFIRTSTYERPFTWEGNYLVFYLYSL